VDAPSRRTARAHEDGRRHWLAAVYRGYATDSGAMVTGTRSRHESAASAKRALLVWARRRREEAADG